MRRRCYLPGMPESFIKYLWGTEGAKQKEGTALNQASRDVRVKRVTDMEQLPKVNEMNPNPEEPRRK